jgi:CO dehydrogenase maturation factor
VNRATPEIKDKALEYARDVGLKVIGVIPEDKVVLKYDFEGKAIIDLPANSKALKAMHKIVERLNLRNSHAKN